jgi:5'-3' exonuclease
VGIELSLSTLMFTGNDFIPNVPSMDIAEGALDEIIRIYKESFPKLGGYIVDGKSSVDFSRLAIIFNQLIQFEVKVLEDRVIQESKDRQRRERRRMFRKSDEGKDDDKEDSPEETCASNTEFSQEFDPNVAKVGSFCLRNSRFSRKRIIHPSGSCKRLVTSLLRMYALNF